VLLVIVNSFIEGNNNGMLITVLGNGQIGLGCTPTEFADDAAAATGGI